MSAEAMCPECGKTVWLPVRKGEYQTAPTRAICDECQELIDQEEVANATRIAEANRRVS